MKEKRNTVKDKLEKIIVDSGSSLSDAIEFSTKDILLKFYMYFKEQLSQSYSNALHFNR
jgi:hypothetical protein